MTVRNHLLAPINSSSYILVQVLRKISTNRNQIRNQLLLAYSPLREAPRQHIAVVEMPAAAGAVNVDL